MFLANAPLSLLSLPLFFLRIYLLKPLYTCPTEFFARILQTVSLFLCLLKTDLKA
jgi:hypothetical protein